MVANGWTPEHLRSIGKKWNAFAPLLLYLKVHLIHKFVYQFPKLELVTYVQPITRSLLRVELKITPKFMWDEKVHGMAEAFWVIVEDVDGEVILYHDSFILKQKYTEEDHVITFTTPLSNLSTQLFYFHYCGSCETKLPCHLDINTFEKVFITYRTA